MSWQEEYGRGERSAGFDAFLNDPELCERFLDDSSAASASKGAVVPVNEAAEQDSQIRWLLASLLELLCSLLAKDNTKEQRQLFALVSRVLVDNQLVPSTLLTDEMYPVRDQYRLMLGEALSQTLEVLRNPAKVAKTKSSRAVAHDKLKRSASDFFAAKIPGGVFDSNLSRSFEPSRYRRDFSEMRELGKGGFGKVFQVKSRVDLCDYAVKRISFDYRDTAVCFRVLREVQLLARMAHANIVRYYGAWFEVEAPTPKRHKKRTESWTETQGIQIQEISATSSSSESFTNERMSQGCLRRSVSTPSVSFGSGHFVKSNRKSIDKNANESTKSNLTNKFWRKRSASSRDDISGFSTNQSQGSDMAMLPIQNENPLRDALSARLFTSSCFMVYIQMGLCSRTLRDYLTERNDKITNISSPFSFVDKILNQRFLRQLLKAVEYIHSRGLIHRDIKPSNVFLASSDQHVLLGDFGLACYDADAEGIMEPTTNQRKENNGVERRHSSGVGTYTYSAPEQLATKFYSSKVDMFSSGIVAYELYQPFRTSFEKMQHMNTVRKGQLCERFSEQWPTETTVIKKLVHTDPELRPTAREIINSNMFNSSDEMIESLEAKVRTQANEIAHLKSLLRDQSS